MGSQVWPQKETEQRLRKKQSLLYSQILETRGMAHCTRPYGKDTGMVRRQKSGASEGFRPLPLLECLRKGMAGQGEQFKTG